MYRVVWQQLHGYGVHYKAYGPYNNKLLALIVLYAVYVWHCGAFDAVTLEQKR